MCGRGNVVHATSAGYRMVSSVCFYLLVLAAFTLGQVLDAQAGTIESPFIRHDISYNTAEPVMSDKQPSASLIFDVVQLCYGQYDREVRPYHFQLYPRNSDNTGSVLIAGKAIGSSLVIFRVEKTAFDQEITTNYYMPPLTSDGHFVFEIHIQAELAEYRFSYSLNGKEWEIMAEHVVCGDVFLVSGQSNASADSDLDNEALMNTRYGNVDANAYGKYSRTYKKWGISPNNGFGNSEVSGAYGVGVWGLRLQYELQKANRLPTCLVNAAVGGTGMDQHHIYAENPFYHTFSPPQYLMGSLLSRVYYAGLEKNIRAIIWYNGEDECGSPNPETGVYTRDFDGLYQSCVDYLGSFRQMYVVQVASYIGPRTGIGYVSEDQRNLPLHYEKLKVMSSNGIGFKDPAPGQHIHFSAKAYAELGRRLFNLIQKDIYENASVTDVLPPDILKVRSEDNRIYLDFNQLIVESYSDSLDNILSVVSFDLPDVIKYNPGIDGNSFYFEVDPAILPLIQEVSYAGMLPDNQYDLKCYLRNADSVATLSFYKMPVTQGENPYGIEAVIRPSSRFKLYPNPVRGIARLSFDGPAAETTIQLFKAATGQLIMQRNETAKSFKLDFTNTPPGIYYLGVSNKYGFASKKVVVL